MDGDRRIWLVPFRREFVTALEFYTMVLESRRFGEEEFGELTEVREQLEFVSGELVCGYVYKVDKEWVWLAISRNVTARMYILSPLFCKFQFLFV
ncbi:unnamed protein product [Brassica oleracea]|uniref:Uncharacterized protein n=1 Tax=Brassica oleracea var. oleracea TaxID=109376 RepID=A0A0D3AC57_BRAOL